MRKLSLFFALVCSLASIAVGQGVIVPPQTALKTVNGITSPIANATITVCAVNTAGLPCSPALSNALFKDAALTQPLSNPFTSDSSGNYNFAIAPGNYTVTVTAAGFNGYSYQISSGNGTAGPGVTLQTNGSNNSIQTLLNLIAGAGINLANSGGAVTITSSPTFSQIGGGTNSTATMTVGSGATMNTSGSGTIAATSVPWPGVSPGSNLNAQTMGTSGSMSPINLGQVAADQTWWFTGPSAPAVTMNTTGGSIQSNHTIYVRLTYNTALGESKQGPVASASSNSCSGGNSCSLVITGPTLPAGYISWNAYTCDTSLGTECTELKQIANNNCTNIASGVNCTVTTAGTGAGLPTSNTAYLQPSGTINTHCPAGSFTNGYYQNASSQWEEFTSIDTQTANPPTTAGHFTFCWGPIYFNDSGVQPDAGVRNAFVSIYHLEGNGTQTASGKIEPALGIVSSMTNGSYNPNTDEQHLAQYGEYHIDNNSFTTCGAIGDEACVGALRMVTTDIRTSGQIAVSGSRQMLSGGSFTFFRNNAIANPYSGCTASSPCGIGVIGGANNLNAASVAGLGFAGVVGYATDDGLSGTGSGIALMARKFNNFANQYLLWIDDVGSTASAFNIRSNSSNQATNGKNFFEGPVYLPNLLTAGGTINVTGSTSQTGSTATLQLSAPTLNSIANIGTPGSSTYQYAATCVDSNGQQTAISNVAQTNTGANPLNGSNFNRVQIQVLVGCSSYNVFRISSNGSPTSLGKIGNVVQPDLLMNGVGATGTVLFNDTGLAGDTLGIAPTNTTGGASYVGYVQEKANLAQVASNFTTAANTNLQTITGLVFNLGPVATNYSFHCSLAYSQATANAAVAFGIQAATNAPTNIAATGKIYTSTTALTTGVLATLNTTTATSIVSATPSATATNFLAELDGTIEEPAAGGDNVINIMVSTATSGDAVTVLRGSYCHLY